MPCTTLRCPDWAGWLAGRHALDWTEHSSQATTGCREQAPSGPKDTNCSGASPGAMSILLTPHAASNTCLSLTDGSCCFPYNVVSSFGLGHPNRLQVGLYSCSHIIHRTHTTSYCT